MVGLGREFHAHLPRLLRKGGIYSYFNGLAADNAFFHLVYCHLVQRELARLGIAVQFIQLPINVADETIWEGVQNRFRGPGPVGTPCRIPLER